jgi:hypothetical protein
MSRIVPKGFFPRVLCSLGLHCWNTRSSREFDAASRECIRCQEIQIANFENLWWRRLPQSHNGRRKMVNIDLANSPVGADAIAAARICLDRAMKRNNALILLLTAICVVGTVGVVTWLYHELDSMEKATGLMVYIGVEAMVLWLLANLGADIQRKSSLALSDWIPVACAVFAVTALVTAAFPSQLIRILVFAEPAVVVMVVMVVFHYLIDHRQRMAVKRRRFDDAPPSVCPDIANFCAKSHECETYRALVVEQGRPFINAEIEAMKAWIDSAPARNHEERIGAACRAVYRQSA